MSLGAFGFLSKPIRTDDVRKVLSTVEMEAGRVGRIR
jgi:hypothetical protein